MGFRYTWVLLGDKSKTPLRMVPAVDYSLPVTPVEDAFRSIHQVIRARLSGGKDATVPPGGANTIRG